jgi:hypothetical protein
MPAVKFFCHWDQSIINATQCKQLIDQVENYEIGLVDDWKLVKKIFERYPEIFKGLITEELFIKFYA